MSDDGPTPPLHSLPDAALCRRLSSGSATESSGHGVSFLLQIGLSRETVTLDAGDQSLSAVRDLVCSIVHQKVRCWTRCWFWSLILLL